MKSTISVLFMLFVLLGCNTEMADLGRISSRPPMVIQMKYAGTDTCNKMAIDKYENIICAGVTTSSMGATTDGTNDGFVTKFDRNGKQLWTVQLQSSAGGNDRCSSVDVDDAGNIYCGGSTDRRIGTGTILNKQYVNPAYVWLERSAAAIDLDGFVAKISPSGQVLWIKQYGTVGGDEGCNNIAVSPAGNSYCGGSTNSEIGTDANSGIDEYLGQTAINPVVAKFDKNGNIKWIRQFGVISMPGKWLEEDQCSDIEIDEDENVYCGGQTKANLADTNGSGFDPFVWMLDKNGFTQAIMQVGSVTATNTAVINVNADEKCEDLAVDKDKNVYCSITHAGDFGEAGGGGADLTVIKWDSSHQVEWVVQLGSVTKIFPYTNTLNQYGHTIQMKNDGTILVAGQTGGSTAAPINGGADILIVNLSTDGQVLWASQKGTSGIEKCMSVESDSAGNVYCAGDTNGNWNGVSNGSADAFILRVDPLGNL